MINLLPPKEEKRIEEERKKKITVILSFLLLFFVVFLGIMLLSLDIYLSKRVRHYREKLEVEESVDRQEVKEIKDEIKEANKELGNLKEHYSRRKDYSSLLEKIDGLLPSNIYLNNFSAILSETEKGSLIKVSLSGLALKREDLFRLKKKLEGEFEEVSFPPANWVQASDINFSSSFNINEH